MLTLLHQWALLIKDVELSTKVERIERHRKIQPLRQNQEGKIDKHKTEKFVEDKVIENNEEIQTKLNSGCRQKLVDLLAYCKIYLDPDSSHEQGRKQDNFHAISAILMLVNWSLGELDPISSISCMKRIIVWFWQSLENSPHLLDRLVYHEPDTLQRFLSIYDVILHCPVSPNITEMAGFCESDNTNVQILISALNRIFIEIFKMLSTDAKQSQFDGISDLTSRLKSKICRRTLKKISRSDLSLHDNVKAQNRAMSLVKEVMLGGSSHIQ
jgi:hypothetical protein